jgi:hypothetical protein
VKVLDDVVVSLGEDLDTITESYEYCEKKLVDCLDGNDAGWFIAIGLFSVICGGLTTSVIYKKCHRADKNKTELAKALYRNESKL